MSGLQKATLAIALRQIYPRFSGAQCSAVFEGYTAGTGSVDVDLVGFCAICEAAATGDRDVAEFADLCVEDFQVLAGATGDDYTLDDQKQAAALKIQAIHRGRQ